MDPVRSFFLRIIINTTDERVGFFEVDIDIGIGFDWFKEGGSRGS
jgi:hypothetical protein